MENVILLVLFHAGTPCVIGDIVRDNPLLSDPAVVGADLEILRRQNLTSHELNVGWKLTPAGRQKVEALCAASLH